jgi:hypothetical protein
MSTGWIPVQSSTIHSIAYEQENSVLKIRFKSGGEYEYENVSHEKYQNMISSPSIGTFFHKDIKPHHKHTAIS